MYRCSSLNNWNSILTAEGYVGGSAATLLESLLANIEHVGAHSFTDMLDALVDEFDALLDVYAHVPALDEFHPSHFARAQGLLSLVESATLWACTRALIEGSLPRPSALFVGQSQRDFIKSCAGSTLTKNPHLRAILAELGVPAIREWAVALTQIEASLDRGRWPHPGPCRDVLAQLESLEPDWAEVVEIHRRQLHYKERQRPGFQRAVRWLPFHVSMFRCLSVEGGVARLLTSDMFRLIDHFRRALSCRERGHQGTLELLIRDVLAPLGTMINGERCPARMGVNSPNRRQRLTRSRLASLGRWSPAFSDTQWRGGAGDQLRRLHAVVVDRSRGVGGSRGETLAQTHRRTFVML